MKKRVLSLTLILAVLFSLFSGTVYAAKKDDGLVEADLVINGDFEMLGTSMSFWNGVAGDKRISNKLAHGGEKALKLSSYDASEGLQIVHQEMPGVIPGKTYVASGYLYIEELKDFRAQVGGGINVEFFKADGSYATGTTGEYFTGAIGKWIYCELEVIAPDEAVTARPQLRLDCGGTIYWDDFKFEGKVLPSTAEDVVNKQNLIKEVWDNSCALLDEELKRNAAASIAPGVVNAVVNPSFEELNSDGKNPKNWIGYQSYWDQVSFHTQEEAHSGDWSVKIVAPDNSVGGRNPWVQQSISDNLVANTDYVLSAWVKAKDMSALSGVLLKIEAYSDTGTASTLTVTGGIESSIYTIKEDEWTQIKLLYTLPEGTTNVRIYIRLHNAGTVYYDDVEFGPTGTATPMKFYSKDTFYYTEEPNIDAFAEINYINFPIEDGNYVDFKIKDGETVIAEQQIPAASKVSATFPIMTLAEKEKAYILEATYRKADGTPIMDTLSKRIYRYDRPTALNEKGEFILDGEPLDIFYLYGSFKEFYDGYKAAGVTVIRPDDLTFRHDSIEGMREILDLAYKKGIKILFPLYGDSAGHPLSLPKTKRIVTEFKDHPALFGWMMMDEPSMHAKPGGIVQSYAEALLYLEEGYKAIRAIDKVHPVYNIETTGVPNSFEQAYQYVDIGAVDPYPSYANETHYTYIRLTECTDAVYDEKPIWSLGYAASWDPTYVPDANAMRMQCWTALWGGASGIGYYSSAEYAQPMIDAHTVIKESGELDQMFGHFVREESPVFNEYMGRDYWARSWVDTDGKMYLLVKEEKNDGKDTEVNFDLTSSNGLVKADGFTARLVNGTTAANVTSNDSTFKLTLKPREISLYEIVPKNDIDVNLLLQPMYSDLGNHSWAENAVERITVRGIANNKGVGVYAPGENITRGDFAMYLVRTLGLTADTTDQFSDVDPNAEYAKEVAIGKALGILKGSGDGTYNPEESISRQDLMVICARGLRYMHKISKSDPATTLKNFSDTGLIADYAVQDISAMVSAKIVTGNADLTINPLGNTTRAEAAVIMDRITDY